MRYKANGVNPAVLKALDNRFRHADKVKAQQALQNQARISAQNRDKVRSVNGLGAPELSVDPYIHSHWKKVTGDPKCWEDKSFRKWFGQKNPETRVKAGGTKIMVGAKGDGSVPRYRKVYS